MNLMPESLARRVFPRLLKAVPEIKGAYEEMHKENLAGVAAWTEQDYEDIREIARIHGTPVDVALEEVQYPGLNIVVENALLPFVIELSSEPSKAKRLTEVMSWIEELATDEEFEVRNLVGTGFCEPLITNQERHAHKIIPFMGKATRQICKELLEMFNVSEQTQRLLDAA